MSDVTSAPPRLVQASSSRYRRELLERLRVPFEVVSPNVDEMPLAGESPEQTALRLSVAKARAAVPLSTDRDAAGVLVIAPIRLPPSMAVRSASPARTRTPSRSFGRCADAPSNSTVR